MMRVGWFLVAWLVSSLIVGLLVSRAFGRGDDDDDGWGC